MTFRIGSVPYLNVKPLVDWFHDPACNVEANVTYAVPSKLAEMLRDDCLDVANVSIFELFRNPDLTLIPGASISARGAVKSVRLFSKVPIEQIRSVALDTSSLTSAALTRILLTERYGVEPAYESFAPSLERMLEACDAGLLIGDLKLFDLMPETRVVDLGAEWFAHTGLPFVFAAWLARNDRMSDDLINALNAAKRWGVARLDELAVRWSKRMELPLERCRDYLINVMDYDLDDDHLAGLRLFKRKCLEHGLT